MGMERKVIDIVKPAFNERGIPLLSAEGELKKVGSQLESRQMTVEQALDAIKKACEWRKFFLKDGEQKKIKEALQRLTR